jgi:hypothetical protein
MYINGGIRGSITGMGEEIVFFTASRLSVSHPASYPMGSEGGGFLGGKEEEA